MSFFDVRIPGLKLTVVATDGQDVEPVTVDELRIGTAEVYDVIVTPGDAAYTIFAQSMDRSGFARGTLAPRAGMTAEVPALDAPRAAHDERHGHEATRAVDHSKMDHAAMGHAPCRRRRHAPAESGPIVDMRARHAEHAARRPGRRPARQRPARAHLCGPRDARRARSTRATPAREIELHLTGHMERYIWSFNGQKFSDADAAAVHARRTAAHHARERHHDDASHPPARHVERDRGCARASSASRKHTVIGAARRSAWPIS